MGRGAYDLTDAKKEMSMADPVLRWEGENRQKREVWPARPCWRSFDLTTLRAPPPRPLPRLLLLSWSRNLLAARRVAHSR